MRFDLAALYVDRRGPYPALAVDCWDEARDATRYAGPRRVIAHPPCGPWGRLWRQSQKDRRDLALTAVEQVRKWGGVLEHPADSKLWPEAGLPSPFSLFPDRHGGRTVAIYQGAYGHPAPKLTWLYFVGLRPCPLVLGRGGEPGRVDRQHSRSRHLTPPDLARALCEWVAS